MAYKVLNSFIDHRTGEFTTPGHLFAPASRVRCRGLVRGGFIAEAKEPDADAKKAAIETKKARMPKGIPQST